MFLARYKTQGKEYIELYGCKYNCKHYEQFIKDTFSPDTEIITIIDFTIHGRTYQERKAETQRIAIEYSNTDLSGLSYGECAIITDFFTRNGKQYHLMDEFTENGIC